MVGRRAVTRRWRFSHDTRRAEDAGNGLYISVTSTRVVVRIRGLALLAVAHQHVWPRWAPLRPFVRVCTNSFALTRELVLPALFFYLISFNLFLPWCVFVCRGLLWLLRTVLVLL